MSTLLFLVESQDDQLKSYSLELASKAGELATALGAELEAVSIGVTPKDAAELGKYGVTKLTVLTAADLSLYNSDAYTTVLADYVQKKSPVLLLGTASSIGRDILPRVAIRLKAGMASDCVDVTVETGKCVAKRPVFAGKALTKVGFTSAMAVISVRPNVFIPRESDRPSSFSVSEENANPGAMRAVVKEIKTTETGEADLTEASIIVSGGRAMANSENFKLIRDLAHVLGGSVGASRAAVDAGYISHEHQVGQTGKTVNPSLYIACGISGAIQHLAGMRTSKVIVAINKDKEAPIFKRADFGVVGDLFQILPLLTEKLKSIVNK